MSKTMNISMSDSDYEQITNFCNSHDYVRSKFVTQSAVEKMGYQMLIEKTILLADTLQAEISKNGMRGEEVPEEIASMLASMTAILKGGAMDDE